MKKKFLCLLLTLYIITSFVPCVYAAQIVDSGTCGADGDNLTWTLDDEGTLKINGEGNMMNYGMAGNMAPWFWYYLNNEIDDNITKVEIADGVTSLGGGSLCSTNIKELNIPKSISHIADTALADCLNLEHITVDKDNTSYFVVDDVLFSKDMKLLHTYPLGKKEQHYTIPNGVEEINRFVFRRTQHLSDLVIPNTIKKISWDSYFHNSILDIYFKGTEEEWKLIDIIDIYGSEKNFLTNITIHYNATGASSPQIEKLSKTNTEILVSLSSVEYDCTIITAFYRDGAIVDIRTIPIKSGDERKNITIPENSKADTAKVFIWNSFYQLKPLCESKSVTIN